MGLYSEPKTHPHKADKLLVAHSLVGLVDGRRTVRATAVAEAGISAAVVVTTLVSEFELTL